MNEKENYDAGRHPGNGQTHWKHPDGESWEQTVFMGNATGIDFRRSCTEVINNAFDAFFLSLFEVMSDPDYRQELEIMDQDRKLRKAVTDLY